MQNAGHYRTTVGDIEVTALHDLIFDAGTGLLLGIDGDAAEAMLRDGFRKVPAQLYVSAFALRRGDRIAMIDAGTGQAMGPDVRGRAGEQLRAIGVDAAQVGTILLTHLHPDHVGGLLDETGGAAFPRAELVMHARERAFWIDGDLPAGAGDQVRDAFDTARRCTAPYRVRTVEGGEVMPGVSIEPLHGHTPGHCGYLLRSGGDSLLIWGDIVHYPGVQFARTDAGVAFDADPDAARATRKKIMARAADEKLLVAGMHLEFPTFGHVVRDGNGEAYRFVPVPWQP